MRYVRENITGAMNDVWYDMPYESWIATIPFPPAIIFSLIIIYRVEPIMIYTLKPYTDESHKHNTLLSSALDLPSMRILRAAEDDFLRVGLLRISSPSNHSKSKQMLVRYLSFRARTSYTEKVSGLFPGRILQIDGSGDGSRNGYDRYKNL